MMRRIQFRLLPFLIALLLTSAAQAQEMTVKSMVSTPMDQTANLAENMYTDNNGDYSGLVKVLIGTDNAEFEGWILKKQQHGAGEYWVFMAKGSDRLTVRVPNYVPLKVNFREYEDCIIKSKQTYVLTILLPQTGNKPVDNGLRYLAMRVTPKNSSVFIDDTQQPVEDGEVSVLVAKGNHRYRVTAPGYAPKEGTVTVDDNSNNKPYEITLVSTQATLRVECETKGAQAYVDGKNKGAMPWSGSLTPGIHQVEARLDGYHSQKQTVTLGQSENRTLKLPALEMIVGRLNVNYRPLGSDVYVDGKKVGTTPNIFRDIQVGNRTVEIRKDGYEPFKKTVSVKENEESLLTGTLTANSSPANTAQSSGSSTLGKAKETITVNGVSFVMVRVPGGTFTMGATSEQGEEARDNEKPTHQVTLSEYSIGETEVTQALWEAVMGNNPSYFKGKPNNPVEQVSWNDCQKFIKKLNKLTGRQFRLPTEAEWEYAARGGRSNGTKYAGSANIDAVAWYRQNAYDVGSSSPDYGTHPVKTKQPNELGLYDMSGNVWEWCQDWYGKEYYSSSSQTNPQGASSGSSRVIRGGSWDFNPGYCRVSSRYSYSPGDRDSILGLRLAL